MSFDGFPPFISAQLHYLLNHFPDKIKVEQVVSGGNKSYGVGLDRFTLLIPYCLDYIKWDVIYNAEFPLAPPDIIFGPEDEDFHPLHMTGAEGEGDLKSLTRNILSDWNNKDPTRLLALIQEMRDQYMSYQRKRVGEVDDDRLKFEISTICSREVIYPVGRKYASTPSAPRLKLMSTIELRALFSIDDVKLPSWLDGMCMAEYLPHLEESLQKQVLEAVSLIDIRRCFIEALTPLFGRPLEADPVFCRKATFLASSGSFVFLVHFLFSTQFPKQQPALMLQSSQHISPQGVPKKSPLLTEYPWSPRWEVSQMSERIFDFLADESLNFKRFCNESQPQH
ncbi:BRISC and BRCA1-A complex member 2-like isoform X2 [Durio zibethinus]|uniref:BRISC and BRCA1-A complex member 2 n=1 Tax=Durio zibethinus TaxID=66656 RepID=A0A6P6B650_DURZI|nr:BRISC and BRCA1-A complex member 2-like isoform X2 [Durio zibethinus]